MKTNGANSTNNVRVVVYNHTSPLQRAKSTGGRIIYAIGDIHGCYKLLSVLLEAIVDDIGTVVEDKFPLLIFCGDYVDRGPQSSDVITMLIWLSRLATVQVVFLRGNHESMLLGFLDHPEKYLNWLKYDGISTLRAYGVQVPDSGEDILVSDCQRMRNELMDRMPASHLNFLRALPIRTICGDYIFVHAGLRPRVKLARQSDEDCLWIGDEFLEVDYKFEKVVVHGHSWSSDTPEITAHRVGIDTGAYSTGVLTATRLDGPSIKIMQARIDQELLLSQPVSRDYGNEG